MGINTPEKKQPYYEEAKQFLDDLIEGKQIELESHGKDKYDRTLGYLYLNNKLINKEILKQGLATLYVYDKDSYFNELETAEASAREQEIGLWEKSPNAGCIELAEFQPIDKGDENETLRLHNKCSFSMNIIIKDNANHIYQETIASNSDLVKTLKNIFNDDGDSLYVRDENGLLLFYRY